MRLSLVVLSILALIITACAPAAATALAPTPTPTAAPTPRTPAQLSQAATLYSGPGNVNYESLANLPAGTTVYPSGAYGDFVQAVGTVAGTDVTDFIWKNALENLPSTLPVLDRLQVP